MSLRRLAVLAVAASAIGCRGGCPGAEVPYNRPPPPAAPRLPAELPVDDAGRPVLASAPVPIAAGYELRLVYDATLDDPISRWGECVARVVACAEANAGRPLDGCMPLVERCAGETGGSGCCPGSCLDAYTAARGAGASEEQALARSVLAQDCVAGVRVQLELAADGGLAP